MSDGHGTDPDNGRDESDEETAREHREEEEDELLDRQREFLEERLSTIQPKSIEREEDEEEEEIERDVDGVEAAVHAQVEAVIRETVEGEKEAVEYSLPTDFRRQLIQEYRKHQEAQLKRENHEDHETDGGTTTAPPEQPSPPPANNWIPIGPSAVRQGQGGVQPCVSGRAPGIAVVPGGGRIYAGTANGGVWRSTDGGETWTSLMDAFDLNPTTRAADSLSCGAIAVVPGATPGQDRIYVGSGEAHFGVGAMFGVGPVVSSDGGSTWETEPVSPGSTELAGGGFFALAVDPTDGERVVAATQNGVYRREPDGSGSTPTTYHWVQKTIGGTTTQQVTSVVATFDGMTTFYAARRNGPVFSSIDGDTWTEVGTGFPSNLGRLSLAARPTDSNVVYAFAQTGNVVRLDTADGTWRTVTGIPASNDLVGGQGWYDLAVAVDPADTNRIFLGGAAVFSGGDWSGALYRCEITASGSNVSATPTYIGNSVHADIHAIVFDPGNPNSLWVGCDGGVFHTTSPAGTGDIFEARNTGLQTLMMNHLGHHETEDAVLFCGTQDNGGERYTGEEAWLYSAGGDCGYFVVNWADPYKVLNTYVRGTVRRSTDGGSRYSYSQGNVPLEKDMNGNLIENVLFYAPLAGTPPNPGTPGDADVVAFGSERPWISETFGSNWQSIPNGTLQNDRLNGAIRSLSFASASKLYAGTVAGGVYRFDRGAAGWTRTRIDTVGGADALPVAGIITDIAVDHADATGDSIYITLGGTGDFRHVWHFDGTAWEQRSGPSVGALDGLIDVQHNAITVDPAAPNHVYAAADIGAWRSTDGGQHWAPFSEGLPDAAVMDLKLHAERRLLRLSTHGRGVFERTLDETAAGKQGVELYVRDTQLDQGRFETVNYLPNPTKQGETVRHWAGPDIKLDTPNAAGTYQFPPTGTIDFHEFVDELTDDFRNVATHATETLTTRVYVQVHNRGVVPANGVRVMLLLANASAGLPALPPGYDVNVRNGLPINTVDWKTLGVATLDDVRVGFPKIAAFDLPSDKLPVPANLVDNDHHCVLALVHHPDDAYVSTELSTDQNSKRERKAAHKNLKVVPFVGTLPRQSPFVVPLRLNNALLEKKRLTALRLLLRGYPGRVRLYVPKMELEGELEELIDGLRLTDDLDPFEEWAEAYRDRVEHNRDTYDERWSKERLKEIERILDFGVALEIEEPGQEEAELHGVVLHPGKHYTVFLVFERPEHEEVGRAFDLEIEQRDQERDETVGGIDVRIDLVPEPDLDEQIDLNVRIDEWRWNYSVVRARLTDGDGRSFTPDDDAVVELLVLDGQRRLQKRTMRWHGGWNSFTSFLRLPEEADAVRATALIDAQQVATTWIRLKQRGPASETEQDVKELEPR